MLLEKSADIQLGPKNQGHLLQQAQSTREAVAQLEGHLKEKYVTSSSQASSFLMNCEHLCVRMCGTKMC